ncbi:ABC transport system ATP-binding protein [Thermoplasma volcanium GSS1]|uniref:ABC transport system ATP-binding protein n=1 Tax=Thermoplasma volcanium (strain ATCC 51530 / DSM 4299 / JCM 9571 / NBRC 15438 / GSS1) TaxID=273116 RepID=Q97CF1_THEVO|nr:ABC transporter ATP-binding protein [Thermoplasma volcanium]BAB59292.1 ABC transport system ATP-binding protein [Thermoplasma volcanium GSS1]
MECIHFEQVSKYYGKKRAIDGLTFRLDCGESMALIGPNGAGKSTTLKILAGILKPDSGSVSISGYDPSTNDARKIVGYLPEDAAPYFTLSVRENLEYIGALRGVQNLNSRMDFLMELLGLGNYRNVKVSALSRGNRQKLAIALVLIHDPKVLLLDEPLNYLDIPSQEAITKYFHSLKATFLVSTHIMSIAERFTSRILIINNGRKVWEGDIQQIKDQSNRSNVSVEDLITRIMGGQLEL